MKKFFGIIGNPIRHSLSPILHNYWFKKYKVDEIVSDFSFEPKHLCHVGVLRFRTEEVRNLFIDSYYKLRRYYLTNIEPTEKLIPQGLIVSTIICQYYFTNICEKNNIKYNFTRDYKSNKYKHYLVR